MATDNRPLSTGLREPFELIRWDDLGGVEFLDQAQKPIRFVLDSCVVGHYSDRASGCELSPKLHQLTHTPLNLLKLKLQGGPGFRMEIRGVKPLAELIALEP